jgi:hypothetical protein
VPYILFDSIGAGISIIMLILVCRHYRFICDKLLHVYFGVDVFWADEYDVVSGKKRNKKMACLYL